MQLKQDQGGKDKMRKRLLSILLTVCMLLSLLPGVAHAANTAWNGSTDTSWYDGSKTSFTLTTAEQLAGLAVLVNSGNSFFGKTINLGADIDLGSSNWTPIGNSNNLFEGSFDGGGHIISNLRISATSPRNSSYGLFGDIFDGTVKNVGLSSVNINVTSTGDSLRVGGLAGNTDGTIVNCFVSGNIIGTAAADSTYNGTSFGGLVGRNNGGTVENCYTTAAVSVSGSGTYYVGGLAGHNRTGSISYSYWLSTATAAGIGNGNSGTGNCSFTGTNSLAAAVTVGGTETLSLLDALNAWLNNAARTDLYTWVPSGSCPVFGPLWTPPTYTATVTVQKDGSLWSDSGKSFALHLSGVKKYDLNVSGSSATVSALTGTYDVFDGTVDTGVNISVSSGGVNAATVNYYDVNLTKGTGIESVTGGGTYLSGETATISATLSNGYTWGKWSDNNTTMTKRSITVSAKTDLTASATLTPATAPSLSVAGANLIYGYTSGSVSVTATPASGHTITGYQWYSNTSNSNLGGTSISGANSDSYALATGKAVGATEYYYCDVTTKRTDSGQTATATSGVATVTVDKADGSGSVNIVGWTYGETAKTPVPASATNGTGSVTYSYEGTGTTSYLASATVPTNAGTYKVTATFAATASYKQCTATATFTIAPATLNKDLFTFAAYSSLAYDGTAKPAAVTAKANGIYAAPTGSVTVYYELKTGESTYGARSTTAPVNAGTYRVSIDVTANGNYATITNLTDSAWTFTIDKATITNCSVSQTGELTYNGSPQTTAVSTACTTAGSQTAAYTYSDTEAGPYSEAIPAHTDAGEYTVYYKVTAANHNDKFGSFTVTIGKLDLSKLQDADITVNPNTVVYTGAAWQPSVTVKSGSCTIPTENYTVFYSNNTNTGNATLTVTAKAPNCTNAKSVTKGITQAELRAEMFSFSAGSALTYDGTAKPATVTAKTNGTYAAPTGNITVYYELKTGDNSYGSRVTTVPTSAGTYRVSIDVTASGNYQGITNLTAAGWNFTIAKAPVSFAVSDNSYTYDAAAHKATVAQTASQTPVIATGKFAVTYKPSTDGSGTADKTDVGVYDVIVTLSDDNFCFAGESDAATRSHKVGTLTIKQNTVTALWKNTTTVYDGTAKAPVLELVGLQTGDTAVKAQLKETKTDAGTYTVTAELSGANSGNYTLTNPAGTFIIQKAPVSFTLTGNSVKKGESVNVTATPSVIGISAALSYWQSGKQVAAPTETGSYDVYAEITNPNYRHAGGTDGTAQKIGVLSIYESNTPATYTVSFDANGGTGDTASMDAAQAGTVRVLPASGFTNTGKTFSGWQYNGKTYQPGECFTQPSSNATLKAQWNDKAYSIGGTVQEGDPAANAANVVVTLMLGSRQIGLTVTGTDGTYSFANVVPGVYNLVANKDGVTQTVMVTIKDKAVTNQTITMPTGKLNSVVEVKAGSPAIVVGDLEKAFTQQDKTDAATKTVELKLTAGVKAADSANNAQQEIGKKAGSVDLFLDFTLTKTVDGTPSTLDTSPVLLTAVITLPAELQGKDSYTVYRYHGAEVQTLTTTANTEGEKIEVSTDKTMLTVYTKNFSAYAIKGVSYSGGGVSSCILTFEVNGGSAITALSITSGTTVDLSAYMPTREGYTFAGWYSDAKLTTAITSVRLTANTTVYAKWIVKGAMPFTDVPADAYYYDAILWALDKGVTSGTTAATFNPGGICTRAQAVTFLWRAMGCPEPTTTNCPFTDVKIGEYYYNAVLWATEKGITKGTSDITFSPNMTVTRSQTMTFLWRTARSPAADTTNPFADVQADAYYADAVLWAVKEGITFGTGTTTFSPADGCSRAQIVTFLYRYPAK